MTKELIEEARRLARLNVARNWGDGGITSYEDGLREMCKRLADALEAATRERAAVPDAATESDAEALENALDDVTRQRDAALAAVERVAALASRAQTFGADEFGAFKRELLAALDGAPEPEGVWEYRGRLQSCGYVAEGYISAEHAMNGLKVELEDHPYLQMDDTAIVERSRVREWLPVEGERP